MGGRIALACSPIYSGLAHATGALLGTGTNQKRGTVLRLGWLATESGVGRRAAETVPIILDIRYLPALLTFFW
jgi:hypothetical protein